MMRTKTMILLGTIACLGATSCRSDKDKAGAKADVAAAAEPVRTAAGAAIEITVTEKGFEPDKIAVKKGQPVTFAFTRKTDKTCATEVVVQVSPTEKIEKALPLDQRVEVTATFPQSGEVKYACGMNMISGVITVE